MAVKRVIANKRRKGFLAAVLPWLKRFGWPVGGVIFILWIGAWFCLSGGVARFESSTRQETIKLTASMGFKIENILVEGRARSDGAAIKDILNENKGAPLFAFNPSAAQEKIEKLDWVKTAQVERRLPDTIYVHLEEHMPTVLWQKDKNFRLLDEQGNIINVARLAPFANLIIVMGDDAPKHAPDLVNDLKAEPALIDQINAARWMDGRRWDLILKNGVVVKLPESGPGAALHKLSAAEKNDKIFEKEITEIDMRLPDRITMRTKPGALESYKARQIAAQTEKAI